MLAEQIALNGAFLGTNALSQIISKMNMSKLNKLLTLVIVILVFAYTTKQSKIKDIVVQNLNHVTIESDIVYAWGSWRAGKEQIDSPHTSPFKGDQVNATEFTCSRLESTCHEKRALLANYKIDKKYSLFAHEFDYQIIEWGSNSLKAQHTGRGQIYVLTVYFDNKLARLDITDNPENNTADIINHEYATLQDSIIATKQGEPLFTKVKNYFNQK